MTYKNCIIIVAIVVAAVGIVFLLVTKNVEVPTIDGAMPENSTTDYVGMTVTGAQSKAQVDGVLFRIVVLDGAPQPTTRDFRDGRINATVDDGVVTAFTVESQSPVVDDTLQEESDDHTAIIGMTVTDAEGYAQDENVAFRLGTVDGKSMPVTLDFQPGRITAEVTDGVVTNYTIE